MFLKQKMAKYLKFSTMCGREPDDFYIAIAEDYLFLHKGKRSKFEGDE